MTPHLAYCIVETTSYAIFIRATQPFLTKMLVPTRGKLSVLREGFCLQKRRKINEDRFMGNFIQTLILLILSNF